MPTSLTLRADPAALLDAPTLLVLGRRERLLSDPIRALLPAGLTPSMWTSLIGTQAVSDDGRVSGTLIDGRPERIIAGLLPDPCSRYNAPSRSWAVPHLVAAARGGPRLSILAALDHPDHALATWLAIARALPSFTATSSDPERRVEVALVGPDGMAILPPDLEIAGDAVRRAAHLVDLPPAQLGPRAFVEEARHVAARTGASIHVVLGEELAAQGLGGLWGVGKASHEPPALVVLDHGSEPGPATAWVGKGITYDTGGLSLKDKGSMPGMKTDMAGAAAVLAAFEAACRLGHRGHLTAVLCLAENAIGPGATRNDDVLRLYSGKTVEINNTDAEGRLVLADGIAWVLRHRQPARVIDLATLTGAQAIATGKRHAAIISNDEALEEAAVRVGRRTGDLVHPLPFAPELFRREFQSRVADMKNSVKDRNNAQSSCAAEFIYAHQGDGSTPWLHVDMAAPAHHGERGTGFGVGLLLGLLEEG